MRFESHEVNIGSLPPLAPLEQNEKVRTGSWTEVDDVIANEGPVVDVVEDVGVGRVPVDLLEVRAERCRGCG